MNIPNEEFLGSIIKYYNGLNFKNKFNLSSEEYKYLRKKYKVYRLVPRNERLCWVCDKPGLSKKYLSSTMCDKCYDAKVNKYYKKYYHRIITPQRVPLILNLRNTNA